MNQREKTCCFTGHRKIPISQYESITRKLTETITALAERGVIYFGAGGALGFDTLAAQTVLNLKNRYPNIGSTEKRANLAERGGSGKSVQASVPGGSWHSWQV